MSDVKRLNFTVSQFESVEPYASEHGQYIRYADYAKLEAEAQALREEVAAANDRADTLEHRMMGMMTRHFAEAWRNRDTEKALDGYLSAGIAELERERDAALAEVAALRARVVVLPSVDSVMNIVMRYQWNEKTNVTGTTNWAANLGMKVVDEVKRLNGKAVSEGVLRQLYEGLDDYWRENAGQAATAELRALLGEGNEP